MLVLSIAAGADAHPALGQPAEIERLRQMIEEQQRRLESQQKQIESMRQSLEKLDREAAEPPAEGISTPARPPRSGATPPEPPEMAETEGTAHVRRGDANVPRTGTFEGSVELPDTGVSLRLGGYVKADMIVDFGDAGSEDLFVTSSIPVDGGEDGVSTRLHARQSRLNVDARKSTEEGPLRVFLEGDFFGGGGTQTVSNSYSFRLRHAFGSFGRLLAGQTWSNFMDVDAFPETLDFEGPPGQSFVRQAQVRWTQPLSERVTLSAAVENPEGDVLDGGASVNTDRLPDVTAGARIVQSWGHLRTAALLRDIKVDNGMGTEDSAVGWGVNVSGLFRTPALGEKDNLVFQFNYGDGIGRYILDLAGSGSDAAANAATGDIETLEAYGGYAGYQHWWHPELRSSVVGGFASLDSKDFQASSTFDNSLYLAGNLVWSPVPAVNLGGEILYGRRENKNGASGDALRFQLSSQFLF